MQKGRGGEESPIKCFLTVSTLLWNWALWRIKEWTEAELDAGRGSEPMGHMKT